MVAVATRHVFEVNRKEINHETMSRILHKILIATEFDGRKILDNLYVNVAEIVNAPMPLNAKSSPNTDSKPCGTRIVSDS
jgi:hypothetical protein